MVRKKRNNLAGLTINGLPLGYRKSLNLLTRKSSEIQKKRGSVTANTITVNDLSHSLKVNPEEFSRITNIGNVPLSKLSRNERVNLLLFYEKKGVSDKKLKAVRKMLNV